MQGIRTDCDVDASSGARCVETASICQWRARPRDTPRASARRRPRPVRSNGWRGGEGRVILEAEAHVGALAELSVDANLRSSEKARVGRPESKMKPDRSVPAVGLQSCG